MRTEKTAARAAARARIAGLDFAARREASHLLCRVLAEEPRIAQARCVMAFAPMDDEPEITPLLQALLARGAIVAMPRLDWDSGSLIPVRLLSFERDLEVLVIGKELRVWVPTPNLEAVPVSGIDVVLVPGLAFDGAGGRLGRGKGFYDRFLPTLPRHAFTCGICFGSQIIRTVPMENHDVPLMAVASERGVISASHADPDTQAS